MFNGLIQPRFGNACVFQNLPRCAVFLQQAQQEQFTGDIGIAALHGRFVHQVKHILQFAAGHHFAALPRHFRQAVQSSLHPLFDARQVAAGIDQQRAHAALRIVQQRFQNVRCFQIGIVGRQGLALRGLQGGLEFSG